MELGLPLSITNVRTVPVVSTGYINGAFNFDTPVSLTTEGALDWMHYGDTVGSPELVVEKSGGSGIGMYTVIGTANTPETYAGDPRTLSWTDGSPTATGSNINGIFLLGAVGAGFQIVFPAGTVERVAYIHVGGYQNGSRLTAHLSDMAASDYVDINGVAGDQYIVNYVITYKANSPGQTLTVTYVCDADVSGNITINGVALS